MQFLEMPQINSDVNQSVLQNIENFNKEIKMEKILIAEDDEGISDFVCLELLHEGFVPCLAKTGTEAIKKFNEEKPDLVLLDIMMPEKDGIEVLKEIRKVSDVPVILETARGETSDKVLGLNAGADDYIAKPFEIEELLARINAVLRRAPKNKESATILNNRDLELNMDSMKVTLKGEILTLSKTEYILLKLFMDNVEKVLSRDTILNTVWGEQHYIDENIVDVYVGYLRSKIDSPSKTEYIRTVRGTGYMMVKE